MNAFESKVLNFIRDNHMIKEGESVLVGLSGGADSMALVTALYELRDILGISIFAAHVNHMIRPEAGEDAAFSKEYCEKRNIPFYLFEEDVPEYSKKMHLTEEEAGRVVRYNVFSELVKDKKIDKVAVAHHQNDAAETFLLNLFRGTGIRGGSGIRPVRDNIIRPLLCVSRAEIEAYLEEKGLGYCTDATNQENDHTRNKLRNVVLPFVQGEVNSAAVDHIVRASREIGQAYDYIKEQADRVFDKCCIDTAKEIRIDQHILSKEPEIIRRYVILKCFELIVPGRKDITSTHVDMIMNLMESTDGSASLNLPYGIKIERVYDKLFFKKEVAAELSKEQKIYKMSNLEAGSEYVFDLGELGMANVKVISYNEKMLIPSDTYTKWFDCDRIQEVIFRYREPEDFIYIEQGESSHKKKLSKFMTDEKIPVSCRDNIYVLAEGNHVLWIPGYRMSSSFKICKKTQKILAITISKGD
jgi:tRNA(Ile)-lysidine synthase